MLDVTTPFSTAWPDHAQPPLTRSGGIVTTIRTTEPVRKRFMLEADGRLTKTAVATIRSGVAMSHMLTSLADLEELLVELSEMPDQCLVLGGFKRAPLFGTFRVTTEAALARMLCSPSPSELPGVHAFQGGYVAARTAASVEQAPFLHLDFDRFPGLPAEVGAMTIGERLSLMARCIPSIDRCARVEARSSSSRVVAPGGQPGAPSFGVAQVSDARLIPELYRHVRRTMAAKGIAWPMAKRATDGSGRVTGHEQRTIVDLSVWSPGRLIFVAPPCVEAAPGYRVVDAGVRMVNADGGPLNLGFLDAERPTVVGWRDRVDRREQVPMEWADEAPPCESAERKPDVVQRDGARFFTLPDPALAVEGVNRNTTMFRYALLLMIAWAEAHGTNEVPYAIALRACLEAVGKMTCDTDETRKQAPYTARSVVNYIARHFVPGVGYLAPSKTAEEVLQNRRDGQRQGCRTKEARSIESIRRAISTLVAAGLTPTRNAVVEESGLGRNTVDRHWRAATANTSSTTPIELPQHSMGAAATALPPAPPPAAPAALTPPRAAAAEPPAPCDPSADARSRRAAARAPLRLDVSRTARSPQPAPVADSPDEPDAWRRAAEGWTPWFRPRRRPPPPPEDFGWSAAFTFCRPCRCTSLTSASARAASSL